jgi:catalase-peroxidase
VSDSPGAVVGETNDGSAGGLGLPASAGRRSHPRRPASNRDWWPNQLDLKVLRKHPAAADPMGDDFDYAAEFRTLDLDALAKDVDEARLIRFAAGHSPCSGGISGANGSWWRTNGIAGPNW